MNEEERSRASSRPRILIVDDSESLCRTLTLILEREGYGTEAAGTGREALDKAGASFFNVALLDIKLPDMEGVGLLAPLKELHPDMALIMVTAHASVETAVRALNEGASAYIIKPLNMDEVLAQVRKALEKQRLVVEKRQAEEALQASEEQLQQIMDTVPEGVLLLDAGRRISLANPAAQAYLPVLTDAGAGEALTHLGGWPIDEVLKPPQEGLRHELLVDAPTPRVFEVASRAMGAGHEASGWILVLRDVTAERHVRQRVEDQERLAALGQMAAGIAHDFNNIMAVIVLYTQMLPRTQELLPRSRERLETICQQAKRATNLVQQVLDFSRASILDRQPLNLLPFLREQLKLLERTLPENIRLDLACGHDEYMVGADSTRMQQVFMNLVLNARDAMPEGGDLRIELARLGTEPGERYPLPDMPSGQWVRVTVSDTGTGIPPEVKPHIFEPFFTTKARGQGTGLGLPQVYGIIKQHEGYIGLDTEVGQGNGLSPSICLPS